ncbi:unnamed protein product [Cyprideis torosa]|uniref:Uncharacterized protein n=1 Tax=Cyprideis torosa TaxID=163714 RepID=A0A7R8ZS41_9CRUS|nr:unnamed protein product [Cyprideis torosa]CAG0895367.1 unnamed protein product [Cyprideis torosa]
MAEDQEALFIPLVLAEAKLHSFSNTGTRWAPVRTTEASFPPMLQDDSAWFGQMAALRIRKLVNKLNGEDWLQVEGYMNCICQTHLHAHFATGRQRSGTQVKEHGFTKTIKREWS